MWCELVMLPSFLQQQQANPGQSASQQPGPVAQQAAVLPALSTVTNPLMSANGTGATPLALQLHRPLYSHPQSAAAVLSALPSSGLGQKEVTGRSNGNAHSHIMDTTGHYHIFVGDLSPEIETQHLKEVFSLFGNVTECKIIKDMHTQKPKGYGFVAYALKEEAEEAIHRMNGQLLGTRTIRTNWAIRRPVQTPAKDQKPLDYVEVCQASSDANTTVYVGGIPNPTEEMLREAFAEYGEILEVRIFKEKGYAFIRLDSHEGATRAIITMHGKEVGGQPCKCSWGKETNDERTDTHTHLLNSAALLASYSGVFPAGATTGITYNTPTNGPSLTYMPTGAPLSYSNYMAAMQKLAAASLVNNYMLQQQQQQLSPPTPTMNPATFAHHSLIAAAAAAAATNGSSSAAHNPAMSLFTSAAGANPVGGAAGHPHTLDLAGMRF